MHLATFFHGAVLSLLLALPAWTAPGAGAEKLKQLPAVLNAFVADETIAGAVALVAHGGKVVSCEAVGFADLAARKPMRKDNLFWIASMTKPITAVAVLMLQDEGKLSIDDPVEKHLPEFRNQMLLAGRTNNRAVLTPPPRKITLRDLLTHSAGLNVETPDLGRELSLAERVLFYSQQPLQFEPGSQWRYSNPGINTLGRVVEVVARKPFAQFLDDRLFQPLGMKDTTFWPGAGQARRLAKSYGPGPGGQGLAETNISFIRGPITARTRAALPAGGLFSTAADLAKFYQMMLDGGTVRGRRLLSEAAVRQLTTTQSGDLQTGFTEGMSWGLGFQVVKQPLGVTGMVSPGTFGHGGAYGTQSWADPRTQAIYVLLIQRARLGNSDGSAIRRAFQETAAAAIRN